jgi:hypothetical protein
MRSTSQQRWYRTRSPRGLWQAEIARHGVGVGPACILLQKKALADEPACHQRDTRHVVSVVAVPLLEGVSRIASLKPFRLGGSEGDELTLQVAFLAFSEAGLPQGPAGMGGDWHLDVGASDAADLVSVLIHARNQDRVVLARDVPRWQRAPVDHPDLVEIAGVLHPRDVWEALRRLRQGGRERPVRGLGEAALGRNVGGGPSVEGVEQGAQSGLPRRGIAELSANAHPGLRRRAMLHAREVVEANVGRNLDGPALAFVVTSIEALLQASLAPSVWNTLGQVSLALQRARRPSVRPVTGSVMTP